MSVWKGLSEHPVAFFAAMVYAVDPRRIESSRKSIPHPAAGSYTNTLNPDGSIR